MRRSWQPGTRLLFCGCLSGRRWAEAGQEQRAKGREQSGARGAPATLTGKPGRFASAISHAKSMSRQGQQPSVVPRIANAVLDTARAFIYFCTKFSFAQLRRSECRHRLSLGQGGGGRQREDQTLPRPSSLSQKTSLKHVQLTWAHL